MKRTIRLLALILTLALVLSAAAMATDIDYEKGKTNATGSVSAVSLVSGCTVAFEGENLKVTFTNANFKDGDMAVVFLLETRSEDGKLVEAVKTTEAAAKPIAPTSSNIKYIDQGTAAATATAGKGSVSFGVYPQNYTNAVVRIISVNAATNKVTDENIAAVKLNYTLGDANGNGTVEISDAVRVLRYIVNSEHPEEDGTFVEQAADMNGNGTVEVGDVVAILKALT